MFQFVSTKVKRLKAGLRNKSYIREIKFLGELEL
jgi:hypothetical protein